MWKTGVYVSIVIAVQSYGCQSSESSKTLDQVSQGPSTRSVDPAYLSIYFSKEIVPIPQERIEVIVRPIEQYVNGTAFIGNPKELQNISFDSDQEYSINVEILGMSKRVPVWSSEECNKQQFYYLSPGKNSFFIEVCPTANSPQHPLSYDK